MQSKDLAAALGPVVTSAMFDHKSEASFHMPPARLMPAPGAETDELALLFVEDLARMFHIGEAAARKRLRLGQFGPYLKAGKRRAVFKRSLVEYLRKSQVEIK